MDGWKGRQEERETDIWTNGQAAPALGTDSQQTDRWKNRHD